MDISINSKVLQETLRTISGAYPRFPAYAPPPGTSSAPHGQLAEVTMYAHSVLGIGDDHLDPKSRDSYSYHGYQKLRQLAALAMETADLSRSLSALGFYNYTEPAETKFATRK